MEKEKLIKLSGDEWHYHLLKFSLNVEPREIRNLCLYFWLTIASLFMFPFVLVWKTVKSVFCFIGRKLKTFFNSVGRKMDTNSYMDVFQKIANTITNGQLYYLVNRDNRDNKDDMMGYAAEITGFGGSVEYMWSMMYDSFHEYVQALLKAKGLTEKDVNSYRKDFEEEYKSYSEARERKIEKERLRREKKEEAARRRRKRMGLIAEVTKKFVGLLLLGCVIFGVMILTNALTDIVVWMLHFSVDWATLIPILLKALSVFASTLACAIALAYFILFSENKLEKGYNLWYEKLAVWVYYPFRWFARKVIFEWFMLKFINNFLFETIILGILNGFAAGFKEFGGIFSEYFSASYNDYCPGIEWQD